MQGASRQTFHARRVARSDDDFEALAREAFCSRLPYALPCAARMTLVRHARTLPQSFNSRAAGSHMVLSLGSDSQSTAVQLVHTWYYLWVLTLIQQQCSWFTHGTIFGF